MQKSTFRVRIFEASSTLIALFAHHSRNYAHIADSATRCECHGRFDEAESLWRQASEQAVQQKNRDWTALRARVCEAHRRFLAAYPARVKKKGCRMTDFLDVVNRMGLVVIPSFFRWSSSCRRRCRHLRQRYCHIAR